MSNNGWIKLHRKLLKNPLVKKPNYVWLWIVLLLKANHKDTKIMWNGEVLIIKEGQILTGRKELSQLTGIPETTIERALTYIEKNGHQIEQQKTTKFRLITIINWKEYQKEDSTSDNKRTTNGQQTDTYKNDKNEKNEKNIIIAGKPAIDKSILLNKFNFPLKENFNKQWQDEAINAVSILNCSEVKKSSIFKCFKDNVYKARIALSDCKELGKLNELYFLKVYNELIK